MNRNAEILFDAGLFIGALLKGDARHSEARLLVEMARCGYLSVFTTTGILSEVYAALTWIKAQPRHSPAEAADAVRLLIEPPSLIKVLPCGIEASFRMLELAEKHGLTARRVHDARHAAVALTSGITQVCTYDTEDWTVFETDGLVVCEPSSLADAMRKLSI